MCEHSVAQRYAIPGRNIKEKYLQTNVATIFLFTAFRVLRVILYKAVYIR